LFNFLAFDSNNLLTRFEKNLPMSFKNKTVLITGASRGIGKAIGLKLAAEGANIVIASKSVEENPKLGGTIFSAAAEMEAAGGKALAVQCDIRFEDQIDNVVNQAVAKFGGIDILINNASAINLSRTEQTEPKRFDLMYDINVRGTFMVSRACIPHLKKGTNTHILNLSPPINMDMKWFANHLAYTISKYNMSMIALGLAAELKQYQIAANALWPRTTIATAAVNNLLGGQMLMNMSRTTDIIADAAHIILSKSAATCTGNTFIDEEVLANEGITDLSKYSVVPGAQLYNDLFV
jgi:citronellol/citronellal dehydrogenase